MSPSAAGPDACAPLGASIVDDGVHFSVFSKHATRVELLLFDSPSAAAPSRVIPVTDRAYHYWHAFVPGLGAGQIYAYRADGPFAPEQGLRFDATKVLIDPYGRAVAVPDGFDRAAGAKPGGNASTSMKSVVADLDRYDWEGDSPLCRPSRETVIYELHVRGFTRHESSGVTPGKRGTYAGLIEKIPYLRALGVTAVELLPVFQFDPQHAPNGVNYWGYQPVSFFAPHHAYGVSGDPLGVLDEFRDMVKALHRAGIEVLLDVVFNHTCEGGQDGPTVAYKGLANESYYILEADRSRYADYTGCGNTLNANDPIVRRMIQDSLRYWVTEMHVDGFRFDLASAITRTGHQVDMKGSLLTTIGQDPVLRHVKLVAEPWDASTDGYRVGEFPPPWVEWNDQYRDTVRDFWRASTRDGIRTLATRLAGSSDLYADDGRSPYNSINFVTSHDGFTLRDLVSYNRKHNEANGERNRDGSDNNRSWNCGEEGETDATSILALRRRQAANLIATLCLSNGVPMLTAGDERGRTQRGNNNAYVQDNEISWVDWRPDAAWLDVHEITRTALRFRREHPALRQRLWFEGRPAMVGGPKDLAWIHPTGREMDGDDWDDTLLHMIGMFVSGDPIREPGPRGEQQHDRSFLLWLNGSAVDCEVTLPQNEWVQHGAVVLSTDPDNPVGTEAHAGGKLVIGPRSLVLLQQT